MKQPKKLTHKQKDFLSKKTRYNPETWVYIDCNGGMHLQNKNTGTIIILDNEGKLIHQIGGSHGIRKHDSGQHN